MSIKLKQITDNIHETVYLSDLESEFISTPYFFRLHDIYQSSTVYMTYPSNRTKRYEHSVGTMEMASDLLFSSIVNADISTQTQLVNHLREQFFRLFQECIVNGNDVSARYYTFCGDKIRSVAEDCNEFSTVEKVFFEQIEFNVRQAFKSGHLKDQALERYQISSLFTLVPDNEKHDISALNTFLFMCLVQALRIAALFHDVGHPPFSHILEGVIKEIYEEITDPSGTGKKMNEEKCSAFLDCVRKFIDQDKRIAYKTSMILTQTSLETACFHERVGLAMLQSSINEVVHRMIDKAASIETDASIKLMIILYYIAVSEFSMCILVESDSFFKSFHKLIDGIVDADRLDYVVRDTVNSGVNWGKIPYKRVAESIRAFYQHDDSDNSQGIFLFAFPEKTQRDIADFLVTRYKIFSWINFHHRCIRTSVALQSCIKQIALDYLSINESKGEKPICSEIVFLWKALSRSSYGTLERRIIQWNDSWLITTLQKAYVDLCSKSRKGKQEYLQLKTDLEEIILNKKWHYALIKRGSDLIVLTDKIFGYAGINERVLKEIAEHENKILFEMRNSKENFWKTKDDSPNYFNTLMLNPAHNALDSLRQIQKLKRIMDTGNIELFDTTMPFLEKSFTEMIKESLEELKTNGIIKDYKLFENSGRARFGLPKHQDVFDEIYLFRPSDNKLYPMNESMSLVPRINAVADDNPYIFVYIVPINDQEVDKMSMDIFDYMAERIGKQLRKRFDRAFQNYPYHSNNLE